MKKIVFTLLLLPVLVMGQYKQKPDTVDVSSELKQLKSHIYRYQNKRVASQGCMIIASINFAAGSIVNSTEGGGTGFYALGIAFAGAGLAFHIGSFIELRKASLYPTMSKNGAGIIYRFK